MYPQKYLGLCRCGSTTSSEHPWMPFPAVDGVQPPLLCLGAAGMDSCGESTQPALRVRIGMVSRPRAAESQSLGETLGLY